jgi:hypothetical protein
MKQLEGDNLNKLMVHLHESIRQTADAAIKAIKSDKTGMTLCYPPGVELNDYERNVLSQIRSIEGFEEVLRKIIVDSSSYPLFDLFSIIDGVSDVSNVNYEFLVIVESSLEERNDRDEFLHDYFHETYCDWKECNK